MTKRNDSRTPKPTRPRKNISDKVRWQVMRRDGFRCRYCGIEAKDADRPLVLDHYVPHSAGGSNDPSNLVTACYDCNAGKSALKITDDLVADVGGLEPIAVQAFLNDLAHELHRLGVGVGLAGRVARLATMCGLDCTTFVRTFGLLAEVDDIGRNIDRAENMDDGDDLEVLPPLGAAELLDMFRPRGL